MGISKRKPPVTVSVKTRQGFTLVEPKSDCHTVVQIETVNSYEKQYFPIQVFELHELLC